MAVKYISYIQTEKLFTQWPVIQGIKESLAKELDFYLYTKKLGTTDGYIYTKTIGNKKLSDMPRSGKLNDSTSDIAINIEKMWNKDMANTRKRLIEEKYCAELVDDKLSIAFKRLSPMQQQILRLFYLKNKTWVEVIDELRRTECYLSKYQAQIQRRYGIERIKNISKITIKMYEYVMDLVEVD